MATFNLADLVVKIIHTGVSDLKTVVKGLGALLLEVDERGGKAMGSLGKGVTRGSVEIMQKFKETLQATVAIDINPFVKTLAMAGVSASVALVTKRFADLHDALIRITARADVLGLSTVGLDEKTKAFVKSSREMGLTLSESMKLAGEAMKYTTDPRQMEQMRNQAVGLARIFETDIQSAMGGVQALQKRSIEDLIAAIGHTRHYKDLTTNLKNEWDILDAIIGEIPKGLKLQQAELGTTQRIWQNIKDTILEVVDAFMESIGPSVLKGFKVIADLVHYVVVQIQEMKGAVGVILLFMSPWTKILGIVFALTEQIKDVFWALNRAWKGLQEAFSTGIDFIGKSFDSLFDHVFGEGSWEGFKKFIDNFWDSFIAGLASLPAHLTVVAEYMKAVFENLSKSLEWFWKKTQYMAIRSAVAIVTTVDEILGESDKSKRIKKQQEEALEQSGAVLAEMARFQAEGVVRAIELQKALNEAKEEGNVGWAAAMEKEIKANDEAMEKRSKAMEVQKRIMDKAAAAVGKPIDWMGDIEKPKNFKDMMPPEVVQALNAAEGDAKKAFQKALDDLQKERDKREGGKGFKGAGGPMEVDPLRPGKAMEGGQMSSIQDLYYRLQQGAAKTVPMQHLDVAKDQLKEQQKANGLLGGIAAALGGKEKKKEGWFGDLG